MRFIGSIFVSLIVLSSCGDSNINGFFVTDAQKEAYDELMLEATALYDAGEYADAKAKAKKAYNMSADNEEASVLYGYVTLALSGIDTFSIAKNMVGDTSDSGNSSSVGFLSFLGTALGVTSDSIASIGTLDTGEGVDEFSGLDVIVPNDMTESRVNIENLKYLNEVISVICPFVDLSSVAVDGDTRHECTSTSKELKSSGKSHFLWAFAHLGEGVYLNEALTYTNEGAEDMNIVARAEKVNTGTFTPAGLVTAVTSLNTTINNVFETGSTKAFTSLFNDLEATSKGLAAIGNVPASFTSGISTAFEKIEEAASSVSGNSGDSLTTEDKTEGLRRQFTESVSESMANKLAAEISSGNVTGSDKDELCTAWEGISQGQEDIGC